ncbi:hypothetical protein A9P82_00145 [Arachidicoccus ginsenosidimutans]|nr:hypothetical protein A9P82_00145 [Arachidicoccus sp. BS20]
MNKKDLIEQIKDRLQAHEEDYAPGAWEQFVQYEKSKKKRPLFWAAAASILLLLGTGAFYYLNTLKNNIAQQALVTNKNSDNQIPQVAAKTDSAQNTHNAFSQNKSVASSSASSLSSTQNIVISHPNNYSSTQQQIIKDTSSVIKNILPQHADTNTTQQLANNNEQEQNSDSGKLNYMSTDFPFKSKRKSIALANRWLMDVVVAPSVSNSNKLNMGYGVAVGYKLSQRLSINSGLSYSQLTAVNSNSNSVGIASSSAPSVETNVTGLSVPLEFRYNLNQKWYVSAGASAMAVLSNKQHTTYIANSIATDAFTSKNGNLFATQNVIAPPKVATSALEQSQGNQNFAGFLNFSLGFKQQLSKGTKFSIEPFISIPATNNFSKQNVHLSNAGVRLKIGL